MKKQELIDAVGDLNVVLFENEKDWIDPNDDRNIVLGKIKDAALWLYASDDLSETTVKVLKEIDWTEDDFKNLKADQDPVPAFRRYGIGPYSPDTLAKETAKKVKEETKKPPKTKAHQPTVDNTTTPPKKTKTKPKEYTEKAPPKKEKATRPKREGPSAYNAAIEMMGPDPSLPIHELYESMKEAGFDLVTSSGSIKTARSIFRRVYLVLYKHGHIVKK